MGGKPGCLLLDEDEWRSFFVEGGQASLTQGRGILLPGVFIFSPDRKDAILKLDRGFVQGDETVLPLNIDAEGGSWLVTVRRKVPDFLFGRLHLVAVALYVLVPCLLVWLPVLARVRKSPEKTGKSLEFRYYAGTAAASFLFFGCAMIQLMMEDSVSFPILLLSVMALAAMILMLFVARELLLRERKRRAPLSETSFHPSEK